MSQKFLIEGLENGSRRRAIGDWRFRLLPRRVGMSRLTVVHTDQAQPQPAIHNGDLQPGSTS